MTAAGQRDQPAPMPLWAGRAAALLGILLVAFNVRTAVSSISPIAGDIVIDVPITSVEFGFIGALPPIAFAFSALFGAAIARRVGVERLMGVAILAMIVGHLGRASFTSLGMLIAGTMLALAGAGIANVLLPPLVKRYFPDRIGLVTGIYVSVVSVSAAVPSSLAVPVAEAGGWRLSLGVWAVVAAVCLLPWAVILVRQHRERARALRGGGGVEAPAARLKGSLLKSRVAWAIALTFSLSSGHVYAAFAWLPQLLVDTAGVTPAEAGVLLAVYAIMGVPAALVVPALAQRMRNVGILVYAGILSFVLGYLGLLVAPAAVPWLWAVLTGLGALLFPVALTLINTRTRTHEGSVALSGFVQGVGYGVAALGPLLFALFHDVSGGWVLPLFYLIVTAVATVFAGWHLRTPVFLEDELARHER
ncbi:MFS transporter [Salinibacterium hongtaonis]|uniref:MFS transporter n=1 Tax=Homoserinimonas hongtaonis TaxID=2079791 RepID=UPI001F53FEED|nr:MFS transporter [Salinibacterium hongtaonis]